MSLQLIEYDSPLFLSPYFINNDVFLNHYIRSIPDLGGGKFTFEEVISFVGFWPQVFNLVLGSVGGYILYFSRQKCRIIHP